MNRLSGKCALITGAGRGLGRAVALAFAREGASVGLMGRTKADLESLLGELPGGTRENSFLHVGDAGDETAVRSFAKEAARRFARFDAVVANAGILAPLADLDRVTSADWDETIRVNLKGPFLLARHTMPMMKRQMGGSMIFVGSGAGKRPAPRWGPYAVAKAGVEQLSATLAAEVARYRIRVNSVNPGGTRTAMRAAAFPEEDPSTLPPPEEVAELFVWLASDEAGDVSGKSIDYRDWRLTRTR